jgi:two-component system, cell cycle response regulator
MSIEMAITDALTGLYNRRYMETHLATAVDQALARGKPLALLLLDVDHFKLINDTYGHDAGDDVLREFAVRLRKSIRGIDLACRYGGEEFVVAMPETESDVAATVAERIRGQIANEPFPIRNGSSAINVTISIGIAALADADDQPEVLLSAPIRRYSVPSATAATGWQGKRPERGRGQP